MSIYMIICVINRLSYIILLQLLTLCRIKLFLFKIQIHILYLIINVRILRMFYQYLQSSDKFSFRVTSQYNNVGKAYECMFVCLYSQTK